MGAPASDSTLWRTLAAIDEAALATINKARAEVRRHVWNLLALRPGGFPTVGVAGKKLTGWIDMDATIPAAASNKQGAAPTFKKTFGFHPLATWCANTFECLAMELRPGNAGSNTVDDHVRVLTDALAQVPGSSRAKVLVRIDGAGATHALLEHLQGLNTTRRTVRYTVGWAITSADEEAIAALPETIWHAAVHQDGTADSQYQVAELSGPNTRTGWPQGLRLIVRRVHPSGRHTENLTALEKRTGWKYAITATDIGRMWGIGGSRQEQWLDAVHRRHAVVEDRVRCDKAMELSHLPSQCWVVNRSWVLAHNLAQDLDAWLRLLTLHEGQELQAAEPNTMRYRLYHLHARLSRHARYRVLAIERTWPWAQAFTTCWQRLGALPALR
ncbi:transposase [Nocardiopsis quinghaiensis]|uniref:transposase n=1 Tax=Nocardiopsis quinghaiensis TaxID=464995 RepID=UPI001CC254B9|nr:transposase [Nocardiopsis quinghaiensis]